MRPARVPPRVYCIPAAAAPVVAVFRRGPSAWAHIGRWDLDQGTYEPGAWFRGRIFPRRSDVSPDGRYLCYFAHKPTARWEHGDSWVAVSRLPWLAALHAFPGLGTWTRGYHFTADGASDHPDDEGLPMPWGLRAIPLDQFPTERRRGWTEAPGSPARDPRDTWDQRRNARLRKERPGGDAELRVESVGAPGGEFGNVQAVDGLRAVYSLEAGGDTRVLSDVQWADWSDDGRLLVATRDAKLQIRDPDVGAAAAVLFERDIAALEPDPRPAPAWAEEW